MRSSPLQQYADGGKIIPFVSKGMREFRQQMLERAAARDAEIAKLVSEYPDWKFSVGDRVRSPKTGNILEITRQSWDTKGSRPLYYYRVTNIPENTEGWSSGTLDALKAHETLIPMTGPKKKAGGRVAPLTRLAGGGAVKPYMRLLRAVNHPNPLNPAYPQDYRTLAELRKMANVRPGQFWTTSMANPRVAQSYLDNPEWAGSLLVPLDLMERPGAVIKAHGAGWRELMGGYEKTPMRNDFKKAYRDPAVRAIMVEDVEDPGFPGVFSDAAGRYGLPPLPYNTIEELARQYSGTNVLIKDPSIVRYLDGSMPAPWVPPVKGKR